MEKLEEELKFFPNINQSKDSFNYEKVIEVNNQSNFESNKETLVKEEKFKEEKVEDELVNIKGTDNLI